MSSTDTSHGLDLRGVVEEPQVVPKPLHQRSGDRNGAFQGEHGALIGDPVGDGGQKPRLGADRALPGVEQHEIPCPIGVLRLAGVETGLAKERRLLITQDRGEPDSAQWADTLEVDPDRRDYLGEDRTRHADLDAQVGVPGGRRQVHQERARRIGDVGDMTPSVRATGEIPGDPGVDGPEGELPAFGCLPQIEVIEQMSCLGAGEVGGQGKTGPRPESVGALIAGELVAQLGSAGVLPDDGVVNGLAGPPVPYHRRLPLVGETHRRQVRCPQAGPGESAFDHRCRLRPDLHRVVLDPSGLGKDLAMLSLIDRDDRSVVVEDHEAGRCGPLVEGADEIGHVDPYPSKAARRSSIDSPLPM